MAIVITSRGLDKATGKVGHRSFEQLSWQGIKTYVDKLQLLVNYNRNNST